MKSSSVNIGQATSSACLLGLTALIMIFSSAVSLRAQCLGPALPDPTGVTEYPNQSFSNEHEGIHSSTLLQGNPAQEKVATVIHQPATGSLQGMRTTVIVNNPSSFMPLDVQIDYFDPAGTVVGTNTTTIPINGHYTELATPLAGFPWGTVRVQSLTPDHIGLVGATLFHTYDIVVPAGFNVPQGQILNPKGEPIGEEIVVREPQEERTGASCMQQLQAAQSSKNELFWGPLPISNTSSVDFFNGNCPLAMVTNPSPNPTTVFVLGVDSQLNVVISNTIQLNGYASWVDMPSFDYFLNAHTPLGAPLTYDLDLSYYVVSPDAIVGEGIMFDVFGGNGAIANRFRMGSTMMANTRVSRLVSPELISRIGADGVSVDSVFGIVNTSFDDIGPVEITYRDRDGVTLGSETIASFPPFSTRRFIPGDPGYPVNNVFAGSVEITSCLEGLVGWNMKVSETDISGAQTGTFQLLKAWGEMLVGGNGAEPGFNAGDNLVRLVGPINPVRTDAVTLSEPGYNHVLNHTLANLNTNFYFIFDSAGLDLTEYLPFFVSNGLQLNATSFSYLDETPQPVVAAGTAQTFINSHFNKVEEGVCGVNAIGGFIYALPWEGYTYPDPVGSFTRPGGGGSYEGPGDVLPTP